MTIQGVCDAWMGDLTAVGRPLEGATQHLYAPWATAQLVNDGKRHVGIWPQATQPAPAPFTVGSLPSDIMETAYVVLVWEDASLEGELRADDNTENLAWINLGLAIQARFRVQANTALGETGGYTRLGVLSWGLEGTTRMLSVGFTVQSTPSFT